MILAKLSLASQSDCLLFYAIMIPFINILTKDMTKKPNKILGLVFTHKTNQKMLRVLSKRYFYRLQLLKLVLLVDKKSHLILMDEGQ